MTKAELEKLYDAMQKARKTRNSFSYPRDFEDDLRFRAADQAADATLLIYLKAAQDYLDANGGGVN